MNGCVMFFQGDPLFLVGLNVDQGILDIWKRQCEGLKHGQDYSIDERDLELG